VQNGLLASLRADGQTMRKYHIPGTPFSFMPQRYLTIASPQWYGMVLLWYYLLILII
jgi:hypothetical protein